MLKPPCAANSANTVPRIVMMSQHVSVSKPSLETTSGCIAVMMHRWLFVYSKSVTQLPDGSSLHSPSPTAMCQKELSVGKLALGGCRVAAVGACASLCVVVVDVTESPWVGTRDEPAGVPRVIELCEILSVRVGIDASPVETTDVGTVCVVTTGVLEVNETFQGTAHSNHPPENCAFAFQVTAVPANMFTFSGPTFP